MDIRILFSFIIYYLLGGYICILVLEILIVVFFLLIEVNFVYIKGIIFF